MKSICMMLLFIVLGTPSLGFAKCKERGRYITLKKNQEQVKHGLWIKCWMDGPVKEKTLYRRGKEVSRTAWDWKGRLRLKVIHTSTKTRISLWDAEHRKGPRLLMLTKPKRFRKTKKRVQFTFGTGKEKIRGTLQCFYAPMRAYPWLVTFRTSTRLKPEYQITQRAPDLPLDERLKLVDPRYKKQHYLGNCFLDGDLHWRGGVCKFVQGGVASPCPVVLAI
jgi:hypothetical protein